MSFDPAHLPAGAGPLLTERHLATLTTLRPDGSPHVTPVGFTWDADHRIVRVICSGTSVKARNAGRAARAAVAVVDGRWWLTLEGTTQVLGDAASVREAELRYARRYRTPRENPARVVLMIHVDRVLGHVPAEPGVPEVPA